MICQENASNRLRINSSIQYFADTKTHLIYFVSKNEGSFKFSPSVLGLEIWRQLIYKFQETGRKKSKKTLKRAIWLGDETFWEILPERVGARHDVVSILIFFENKNKKQNPKQYQTSSRGSFDVVFVSCFFAFVWKF